MGGLELGLFLFGQGDFALAEPFVGIGGILDRMAKLPLLLGGQERGFVDLLEVVL